MAQLVVALRGQHFVSDRALGHIQPLKDSFAGNNKQEAQVGEVRFLVLFIGDAEPPFLL